MQKNFFLHFHFHSFFILSSCIKHIFSFLPYCTFKFNFSCSILVLYEMEKFSMKKKKMHFVMKMNSNMGWDIMKKKVVNSETYKEKNVCLHIIKNIRFFHHHSCMFNNSKIYACKIIRLSYSICLFCIPNKICNFKTIKFLFPAWIHQEYWVLSYL